MYTRSVEEAFNVRENQNSRVTVMRLNGREVHGIHVIGIYIYIEHEYTQYHRIIIRLEYVCETCEKVSNPLLNTYSNKTFIIPLINCTVTLHYTYYAGVLN